MREELDNQDSNFWLQLEKNRYKYICVIVYSKSTVTGEAWAACPSGVPDFISGFL
jgi:hypothetical protein